MRRLPTSLPLATGVLLLATLLLSAGATAAAPEPRGTVAPSRDGQLVVDIDSGLAWARCVEGMRWNGRRCTGTPLRVTQSQANDLAAARRQADGRPWRVPRAIELRRVMQRGDAMDGGLGRLFPDTPPDWQWTASASIDASPVNVYNYDNVMRGRTTESDDRLDGLHAWAIDARSGRARPDMPRDTPLPVRLVRPRD